VVGTRADAKHKRPAWRYTAGRQTGGSSTITPLSSVSNRLTGFETCAWSATRSPRNLGRAGAAGKIEAGIPEPATAGSVAHAGPQSAETGRRENPFAAARTSFQRVFVIPHSQALAGTGYAASPITWMAMPLAISHRPDIRELHLPPGEAVDELEALGDRFFPTSWSGGSWRLNSRRLPSFAQQPQSRRTVSTST